METWWTAYSIIYHHADRKNMFTKLKNFSLKFSYACLDDYSTPNLMIMILLESFVPRSEMDPNNYQPFLKNMVSNQQYLKVQLLEA